MSFLEMAPELDFDLSLDKITSLGKNKKEPPVEHKKNSFRKDPDVIQAIMDRADVLARAAGRSLATDPMQAFRLAEASILIAPNPKAEAALWKSLEYPFYCNLLENQKDIVKTRFSSDGKSIAAASTDFAVRIFDVETRQIIRTINTEGVVYCIAFSPDGRLLAGAGADNRLKVWDIGSGRRILNAAHHTGRIRDVCFSPDGRWIATASKDKRVVFWNADNGKPVKDIRDFGAEVTGVSFSNESNYLITVSGGGRIGVYKTVNGAGEGGGKLLFKMDGFRSRLRDALISPNGRHIIILFMDDAPQLWDVSPSFRKHRVTFSGRGVAYAASFSADGQYVVTANEGAEAHIWEASSGKHVYSLKGHRDAVLSASFSPAAHLAATGSKDGAVKLWSLDIGIKTQTFAGHDDQVIDVAFSPDGERLLSASLDNSVRLWNLKEEKEIFKDRKNVPGVSRIAFSPDNVRFAAASGDGVCRIWDTASGILLHSLERHTGAISNIAYSPDGGQILTGSIDRTAILWDALKGASVKTFKGFESSVINVGFLFGEHTAGIVTGGGTLFIAPPVGDLIRFDFNILSPEMKPLAIFPNDVLLTEREWKNAAFLWRMPDIRPPLELVDAGGVIHSAAVSPKGEYIAAVLKEGGIVYYHIESGELVAAIDSNSGKTLRVAFSPDGNDLACASSNGLIHVRPIHYSQIIRAIREDTRRGVISPMSAPEIEAAVSNEKRKGKDEWKK